MEHRPDPQMTFAEARYSNSSHPIAPTFPAGCDLFASLSNVDSVAHDCMQVAVPTLSMLLLVLWIARRTVLWVQWRRMTRMAQSWATLPNYAEAQVAAATLRLSPSQQPSALDGEEEGCQSCMICLSSPIDHPIALLPCRHQQFCARCIVQLWEHTSVYRQLTCPLCRSTVELTCPIKVGGAAAPSIDAVILLHKYNGGFCGGRRHSLLDRWVLQLRAVTNARLLPFVIGLRIVMLHATIFTYMLLPINASDIAAATTSYAERVAMSDSAWAAAWAALTRAFVTVLYTAVMYADDLFVVAVSIILTGSLLQSALFTDLKV